MLVLVVDQCLVQVQHQSQLRRVDLFVGEELVEKYRLNYEIRILVILNFQGGILQHLEQSLFLYLFLGICFHLNRGRIYCRFYLLLLFFVKFICGFFFLVVAIDDFMLLLLFKFERVKAFKILELF